MLVTSTLLALAQPAAITDPQVGDSLAYCGEGAVIDTLDERTQSEIGQLVDEMVRQDKLWRAKATLGTHDDALAAFYVDELATTNGMNAYIQRQDELKARYGREMDEAEDKRMWFDVRLADARHVAMLAEISRTYGWPDPSRTGGIHDPAFILMHQGIDETLERRCLWVAEARAGRLEPKWIANMMDKVQQLKGEPFVYGVGVMPDANGNMVPIPVRDEAEANRLRAEIGLPPRGQ